ncbi:MAG: hypothetical protein JXI33_07400 [Candidatus Aminicenantes bacterium]|nr:hypothetical protein [Candidatus Aminicenantes bacterium]
MQTINFSVNSILKKGWFLHPILFATTPVLFLFSHNIAETPFQDIFFPAAVSLALGLIGIVLLFSILKNIWKASVLTSLGLMLFFSYGHFFRVIRGLRIGRVIVGRYAVTLPFYMLIFIACAIVIIKINKSIYRFTQILNISGIVFLLTILINIVIYSVGTINPKQVKIDFQDPNALNLAQSKKPDIYYIILDGYSRQDVLQEYYSFDNSDFINYLKGNGFIVTDKSNCNYSLTFLSLASSLNMTYFNSLYSADPKRKNDRSVVHSMIHNNIVVRTLKAIGYKIINFSSGWGPTNFLLKADCNYSRSLWNEFTMMVVETSMFSIIYKKLYFFKMKKEILSTLDQLSSVDNMKEPRFVLAHIVCPHPPFFFDQNGNPVATIEPNPGSSDWLNKSGYVNQLLFINNRIKNIIKSLLNRERKPIIVLQADHGSASSLYVVGSSHWKIPDNKSLRERVPILNAIYFPAQHDPLPNIPNSISPVNTFRYIFNCEFGTNYEILPDKSFFSSYDNPYKFLDVTSIVSE